MKNEDILPDKYTFNHLPVALVTHQGVLRVSPVEPTTMLNVTHSRPIGREEVEEPQGMKTPSHRTPSKSPHDSNQRSVSIPFNTDLSQLLGTNIATESRDPMRIVWYEWSLNGDLQDSSPCVCMHGVHCGKANEAMEALQQHRKNNHPATQ